MDVLEQVPQKKSDRNELSSGQLRLQKHSNAARADLGFQLTCGDAEQNPIAALPGGRLTTFHNVWLAPAANFLETARPTGGLIRCSCRTNFCKGLAGVI